MHNDFDFVHFRMSPKNSADFPLNFNTHRFIRLHHSLPSATRTLHVNRLADTFLDSLPRHLQQPKGGDGQSMRSCAIPPQAFLEFLIDRDLVASGTHVNEVDDDDSTKIS